MFTGIITDTTSIVRSKKSKGGLTLTFQRPRGWDDLQLGESVATNGACLTVAALRDSEYDCVLIPETLNRTAFGSSLPEQVNLERAMGMADRFSGHFVQGHVDGIGTVRAIDTDASGWRLSIAFSPADKPLVIYKGSVTMNGVSLTVAAVEDNVLTVALIPHTLKHTTLESLQVGGAVNLEFDMIGKYVVNSLKLRGDA